MGIRIKRRLKSVKDPVQRKNRAGTGGKVKMTAADKTKARLAKKRRYSSLSEADKKFDRERAKFLREKREGIATVAPVLEDMGGNVSTSAAAKKKRKLGPGDKDYNKARAAAKKAYDAAKKAASTEAKSERARINSEKAEKLSANPKKKASITKKAQSERKKVTADRKKALEKAAKEYRSAIDDAHKSRNAIREKEGLKPLGRRGRPPKGSTTKKSTTKRTTKKSTTKKKSAGGRPKGALNKKTYTKLSTQQSNKAKQGAGDTPGDRRGKKFNGKTYKTLQGAKAAETRAKKKYGQKASYDPGKIGGGQTGAYKNRRKSK